MELTAIGTMEALPEDEMIRTSTREARCRLIIADEYAVGLMGLANSEYIQVIFGLARTSEYALKALSDCGDLKGIFATRHPWRPSRLQVVTVRLLGIEDNVLIVEGPTIKPGSFVYDLMPFSPILDSDQIRLEAQKQLKVNPRQDFISAICADDRSRLLIKVAEIHGHFCPGSALGVMASIWGLEQLGLKLVSFDGLENLMAVVETNACFADGVQVVSGCTLGNNALVYRDLGRHAVTFAVRGQETGVRIRVQPDFQATIDTAVPEFYPLLDIVIENRRGTEKEETSFKEKAREAAFALIKMPFEKLLITQTVRPVLPGYAPITDSIICPGCKEQVMATKTVTQDGGDILCFQCAGRPSRQVDGRGIGVQ